MKLFTAPDLTPQSLDLFLAGGITDCPNWQAEVVEALEGTNLNVGNPRREVFTKDIVAQEQIRWEYFALEKSTTVLFWFPKETLCPITLYELGVISQRKHVNLIVGTHPNYARRVDVIEQLALARPEVEVVDLLPDLIEQMSDNFAC